MHVFSLRLALRAVARHRRTYLLAAAILGLGIGMSTAMFSLVDAVLIRPLPFPHQESIDVIWKVNPQIGPQVVELAYPELLDLQAGIKDFEYVAVMPTSLYGYGRVLQIGNAEPMEIESAPVSHDFFRVLGVSPSIGRDFTSEDERPGAAPVAIVSDRVWRDQLNGDRHIVGQTVRLNGQASTIIGVMAPGVEFPRGAGLWIPLGVEARIVERRGATFLQAIALVKPGSGSEHIANQLNALFKRQAADHPDSYSPSQQGLVTPLVEYWTGSARIHLWVMLGASLLLLIASAISAGNLLLARTLSRSQEIATRLALGARLGQILAQLTAEGAIVTIIATAAGLIVAQTLTRLLVTLPPADIPRLTNATLDPRSFGFAVGIAAFAGVACALIPGWSMTRSWSMTGKHLDSALREGGARLTTSRRESRVRGVFLFGHAAATVILLAMATLLVLSYRSMLSADIGFENRDALSMNLTLRGPGLFSTQAFDVKARRAFYAKLLDRLRRTSGVTSAAAVLLRPLEGTIGWDVSYEFEFEEGRKVERDLPKANYETVTPGYFETVGTQLLEGRDFDEHDSESGPPVVIVNRALAERIRADGRVPVGSRVQLGLGGWATVIGVCGDARYRAVTESGTDLFVPSSQASAPTNYLVLRGTPGKEALVTLVRQAVAELDPNQAISGVATIGEMIAANTARHRFNMTLLLWFAVCALILAASGVHAVVAESLAARQREIAIKFALGASRGRLTLDLISNTLFFVLIGIAVGLCGSVSVASFASNLLYQVSSRNPLVLAVAPGILFTVSAVAAIWPVRRATAANPKLLL